MKIYRHMNPSDDPAFKTGKLVERDRILKLIEIRKHTVQTLSKHSISKNLVRQVTWELDRLAKAIKGE